jgi:dTMP kinase
MFISFEGINFCGKSTQVELLRAYLESNNKQVQIIREPGGTEISEKVRQILLDKKNYSMVTEAEIFLFSASRAQLVREKIRPYLIQGIYVISDRFHDSTTAYQGFARGIPLESVKHINNLAIGDVIPDITFFIDIPVEVAEKRKYNSPETNLDRIELQNCDFYNKVRDGYLYLAETEKRFRKIDGTMSVDEIHTRIINEIILFERRS